MCGICGILRCSAEAPPPDADELARISAALSARGPDGRGEWASPDGRLLLAHRRLSILDLSPAGAQPMTDTDGRFTIVYNGEIYNFAELRAGLVAHGARFEGTGDTEVILELWRREGVDAVRRLRGMFAFAVWDAEAGELTLVRDPYGIKPLYYAWDGATLRFASQVRALEAGGGVSRAVDPAGVAGFLSWGAVPEPLTIRREIRALPAGHLARVGRDAKLRIEALSGPDGEDAPESSGEAVAASVRAHLVADVPVGIFLSAGLDSALVAAAAARAGGEPPTALTLTWAEARGTPADEEPLARRTATALGLPHVVREVDGVAVRSALGSILAAMDQPSIDGFNTWLVARVAREAGLKVALSGLGGDELLGGYRSFRDVPRWRRWAAAAGRVPGAGPAWRWAASRFLADRPKAAELPEAARSLAGAYALRRSLFLPREIDGLLARFGLAEPGRRPYDAAFDAWRCLGEATLGDPARVLEDPWRAVHRLESSLYLRHQLLRDADWAGMAHGVEIRVPLVDARLRGEIERLGFEPARSGGKGALVAAAAPELPGELLRRSKSGFQLPILEWLGALDGAPAPTLGGRSRQLALRVLAEFGLEAPSSAATLR